MKKYNLSITIALFMTVIVMTSCGNAEDSSNADSLVTQGNQANETTEQGITTTQGSDMSMQNERETVTLTEEVYQLTDGLSAVRFEGEYLTMHLLFCAMLSAVKQDSIYPLVLLMAETEMLSCG